MIEALARVRRYIHARGKMTGLDPDEIHSLHIGTEREARLTLADLRELFALAVRFDIPAGDLPDDEDMSEEDEQ